MLSLAALTACAVDPAPQASTPAAESPSVSEAEVSDAITATPIHSPSASCAPVWECDLVCGRFVNGVLIRFPTNVLHLECDDGTDSVIRQDPCGEDCF
jgi:hypothetical protein